MSRDFAAEYRQACHDDRFGATLADRWTARDRQAAIYEAALDADVDLDVLGIDNDVLDEWYAARTVGELENLLYDPATVTLGRAELARRGSASLCPR